MNTPSFLIIGAAKSGTSTLFSYLRKHPQVFSKNIKEPNFFGSDENYAKGMDAYHAMFAGMQPDQIAGEASTDYAKWPMFPESATRIAKHLPQVKLIYIMRNPVDRAYSYYVHVNRNKPIRETFEQYIARTSEALDASNYMLQINRYLQYFPKESFLFLLLEDMERQPDAVVKQVCRFLEIDDTVDCTSVPLVENLSTRNFEDNIRGKITAPLKAVPLVKLVSSAMPQPLKDKVYSLIRKSNFGKGVETQYLPVPMLPETREYLIKKFSEPNRELANFIGRDLSHWNELPEYSQRLPDAKKSTKSQSFAVAVASMVSVFLVTAYYLTE